MNSTVLASACRSVGTNRVSLLSHNEGTDTCDKSGNYNVDTDATVTIQAPDNRCPKSYAGLNQEKRITRPPDDDLFIDCS